MTAPRDKQLELLRTAVKLAEENPALEIHVCAASDELLPDYSWTDHQITRVIVDWQYDDGDAGIQVGLGDIRDSLEIARDEDVTEDQAKEVSKQVILIYTGA